VNSVRHMKKKVPYSEYLTFYERILYSKINENRSRQALPQVLLFELFTQLSVEKNSRKTLKFTQ
jgi:hypothetical protein